jgi:hypothetical protein
VDEATAKGLEFRVKYQEGRVNEAAPKRQRHVAPGPE